jgi:hypothetical protein
MIDYSIYVQCIIDNLKMEPLKWSFKSDQNYNWVLEHLSREEGYLYLNYIKNEFSEFYVVHKNKLIEFCHTNDFIGKPYKVLFEDFCECSPTNLRYIYHALLALKNTSNKYENSIDIVEIGGGYGGLCYFIHKLAELQNIKIKSYIMFDLPSIINLQKLYLSYLGISINTYLLSDKFILNNDSYFISTYAFTELSSMLRKEYEDKVISYCNHGFVVWNFIEHVYNFTKNGILTIEEERPQTAYSFRKNLFISY